MDLYPVWSPSPEVRLSAPHSIGVAAVHNVHFVASPYQSSTEIPYEVTVSTIVVRWIECRDHAKSHRLPLSLGVLCSDTDQFMSYS